jgi:spore coat protein A, manganese oxidase
MKNKRLLFFSIITTMIGFYLLSCQKQNPDSFANSIGSNAFVLDSVKKTDIKIWDTTNVFVNEIFAKSDKIELEDPLHDSTSLEIRAFQHKFYDNIDTLKPTWVLGYVRADTEPGTEKLPGPTIETYYGMKTKIHFKNMLNDTTYHKPPLFQYKGDICRWYPIVYNVHDSSHVKSIAKMLYPKPKNGIPICGSGPSTVGEEMASYYGTTVHLHGSNSAWRYDGYPNSSYYDIDSSKSNPFENGVFGSNETHKNKAGLTYYYTNDFPEPNFIKSKSKEVGKHGAILWYHDHSMMRTATNVYAGLLAPYIIEDTKEKEMFDSEKKSIYSVVKNDGERNYFMKIWDKFYNWMTDATEEYDIPLVINDKTFLKNGMLYYNTTADVHDSENRKFPNDSIQPEFFGNTMVVNGKIWPKMSVGHKRYRFRLLNTCSSRTLSLGLATKREPNGKEQWQFDHLEDSVFIQIGTESGLMPHRVRISKNAPLTLAPGERADVIIDFTGIEKSKIALLNFAADEPFGDDSNIMNIDSVNAALKKNSLMNVVMEFDLLGSANKSEERFEKVMDNLEENSYFKEITEEIDSLSKSNKNITIKKTFELTLKEFTSQVSLSIDKNNNLINFDKDPQIYPFVLMNGDTWDSEKKSKISPIKTVVDRESIYEIWKIVNKTPDMHPIHIHLNRFEVLGRDSLNSRNDSKKGFKVSNLLLKPKPNEIGWKDVVQCPTGMITYIKIKYKLNHNPDQKFADNPTEKAQFVYHCHILEHEDVSMMRRLIVQPKENTISAKSTEPLRRNKK